MPIFKPILKKNFLDQEVLNDIRYKIQKLKELYPFKRDDVVFNRSSFHNAPFLIDIHQQDLTFIAMKIFRENLKASYNYISCYDPGKGFCPMHTDRPSCYRTIDICINQNGEWPIFVNSHPEYSKTRGIINPDHELYEKIKETSDCYILQPGDALCYSGTDHPHWRNRIPSGQFCDLIFFHFVPETYKGDLD